MSTAVVVTETALNDIDAAHAWYEAQQTGRGDVFLDELRDHFLVIGQNPAAHGWVTRTTRAAPLPRSKFIVYYRIEPNQVVVTAVQHVSANPQTWQRRR